MGRSHWTARKWARGSQIFAANARQNPEPNELSVDPASSRLRSAANLIFRYQIATPWKCPSARAGRRCSRYPCPGANAMEAVMAEVEVLLVEHTRRLGTWECPVCQRKLAWRQPVAPTCRQPARQPARCVIRLRRRSHGQRDRGSEDGAKCRKPWEEYRQTAECQRCSMWPPGRPRHAQD